MKCISDRCNYKGEMEIRERGPHIGPYCPKCDKWQGEWLKKTEENLKRVTKKQEVM